MINICFHFLILYFTYRSSHRRCSLTKRVLRNLAKFTGKHLCQSLFFNKVAGLRPATLLKKRLWHRCFPVNFTKFLRTTFFIEHVWWLLLYISVNDMYIVHQLTSLALATKLFDFVSMLQIYVINFGNKVKCVFLFIAMVWAN